LELGFTGHFKKLTADKKRYFLLKYEIGISETAIARALGVNKKSVEKGLMEAEYELHMAMDEAGYKKKYSLDRLYRESRVVKPPASWDKEIIDSFDMWLKQTASDELPEITSAEPVDSGGIAQKLGNIKDQVRSKISGLGKRPNSKGTRVRKIY
jgi:IS30 family transposase